MKGTRSGRMLKESRNNWKEKALQRQKEIRKLQIKVRDLSKSRDNWKRKALEAQRKLEQLKKAKKTAATDGNCGAESAVDIFKAPLGHVYPVFIIQLAIQQVIYSLNSLRGCQKNFSLFSQFFAVQTPTFNTIRNWLLRFGLYELRKKHTNRDDWIIILDLTIELGDKKCLVILGIPAEQLKKGYNLQHQDVSVLDMAVLSRTSGEIIQTKLAQLSEQVGTPLQILADHGSDLKKGISLYQQQNPEVIYTYDVTHKMALLLKHELAKDERFQSFLQQCRRTRQQVQQTKLYFLAPPKERVKSRYLNLESLVSWALKVLARLTDLQISSHAGQETLSANEELPTHSNKRLLMSAPNSSPLCGEQIAVKNKLGWLVDYQADIQEYAELIRLVNIVQKQLKQEGLNRKSKATFIENTRQMLLTTRARAFKAKIETYLAKEGDQIPDEATLLATSDIIESIFGKYKFFSSARPLKEIGQILLMIPLFTADITTDNVLRAMESVRMQDVEKWTQQMFGQSMLSKRRAFLQVKLHEYYLNGEAM